MSRRERSAAGRSVPEVRRVDVEGPVPDLRAILRGMWVAAGLVWAAAGLAALPAAVDALSPDIAPGRPETRQTTPEARRTAHSGAPGTPELNPVDLIIQQNPHCWLGVPGVTCGPERTYR